MRHARERNLTMRAGVGTGVASYEFMRVNNPRNKPQSITRENNVSARMTRLAEVRPAVVARGKALIANPNYPDRTTMKAVGRLLAKHLAKQ